MTIFVEWVPPVGQTTFTHDYALDGDEELVVGKAVDLTDGIVTRHAHVTRRDEPHRYWFFEVDAA